jgi:hypothetical protein
MIVDVCDILEETSNNILLDDYGVFCKKKSYKNLIQYYIQTINCCDCSTKPAKCNTKKEICDNSFVIPACCNLCIYPNNEFPEQACAVSIFPNNTVINVKIISPNNETKCQE